MPPPNPQLQRQREIDAAWAEHDGPPAWRSTGRHLQSLCEAQNWRCCYCGQRMDGRNHEGDAPSVEHVVPRSLGGTDARDNLVAAHRSCNSERGNAWRAEHVIAMGDLPEVTPDV